MYLYVHLNTDIARVYEYSYQHALRISSILPFFHRILLFEGLGKPKEKPKGPPPKKDLASLP